MNHDPLAKKLSVIIPAYERMEGLPRAIRSVLSQIDERAELIVVDDGSEQSIEQQLDFDEVHWLTHTENLGAAAARNSGAQQAKADWVTFLDADDCWLPGRFAQLMEIVDQGLTEGDERPQAWVSAVLRRKGEKLIYHKLPPRSFDSPLRAGGCRMCPGSTLLLHKLTFEIVGEFDEDLRRLEDYEWFLRFFAHAGQINQEKDARIFVDGSGGASFKQVFDATIHIRFKLIRMPKIVGAYLNLELARAAWREKDWWLFTKHLFYSRNQYRRFGLQVQPASTRKLNAGELDLLATLKTISD